MVLERQSFRHKKQLYIRRSRHSSIFVTNTTIMITNFLRKKTRTLFIYGFESNSGGYALNSSALSTEIEETNRVKIWDNINNDGFENLHIGVNNLLGHRSAELWNGFRHGFELQMSNYVKQNYWGNNEVYLLKCGQGGSKISNWVDGVSYLGVDCWGVMQNRLNLSLLELRKKYKLNIKLIVSFGINDAIAGTSALVFKTKFKQLISNIRAITGNCDIYATQIMLNNSNYIAINNALIDCENEITNFKTVSVLGATLIDSNHWDYSGLKLIFDRMISAGL